MAVILQAERWRWTTVTAALILIAAATLIPVTGEPAGAALPFWCVACGDYDLADALANVALFAPLGWAVARTGAGPGRGVALILATTLAVEWLQHAVVPGRVASGSDVVANTVGGIVGMALPGLRRWVAASQGRALGATAIYGTLLVAGVSGGVAMQAVPMPRSLRWMEESPPLPGYMPFAGTLEAVRVNGAGVALRDWAVVPPRDLADVAVDLVSAAPDARRAEIISADQPAGPKWMWVDQQDRDLQLHLASAADGVLLRSHALWVRDVMPGVAGEAMTIQVDVRTFSYRMRIKTTRGEVARSWSMSPGDGWRLFAPFERSREPFAPLLSGVWLAALAAPLGYLASLRSRAAVLVSAAGAGAYVLLLPLISGCAWLPVSGWCGAIGGLALGVGAGRIVGVSVG